MSGLETGGEADEMQLDAPTILVDLVIQGVPSAIREKIRGPGPGVEAPHSLADGAAGFGLAGRQVRRGPRHAPHHQQLTRRHGLTPPGPGTRTSSTRCTTIQVGAADFVLDLPKNRFNEQV